MKFENMVVYENNSDKFDIGHCQIKVKVTVGLSHMLQYNKSTLTQARELILMRHACSTDNNIPNL